jgi:hypothetical protein
MNDEFTNDVPDMFRNAEMRGCEESKGSVKRPWNVSGNSPGFLQRAGDDPKRNDLAERVDKLYSELRSSLTIFSALEYDHKKADQRLEEVNKSMERWRKS